MLRSYFVFTRLVDDREFVAVGQGKLPVGTKQVGCFASLDEAIAHRDRLRRGQASMPTWATATRPRAANAY
jgi:hypothetical protein